MCQSQRIATEVPGSFHGFIVHFAIGLVARRQIFQREALLMGCTPSSIVLLSVLNTELFRPAQPVAAIDSCYCTPRPATLHFKRSTFTGSFQICAITNNNALQFRTAGRFASFSSRQTRLLDASRRSIVNFLFEDEESAKPYCRVSRSGNNASEAPLFQIYARAKSTATDLRVEFTDRTTGERCNVGMYGSWVHRTAIIWLRQGPSGERKPVAKLYPPPHNTAWKDEFCLSIGANVDAALMALICVVLHDRESQGQQS